MGIEAGLLKWREDRKAEFIGKRFGRLVVQAFDETTVGKAYKYVCLCDCGNTVTSFKSNLKRGEARSCGCLRAEEQRKFTVATANEEYSKHRHLGTKRGLGHLTRLEWDSIVYQPCEYCGLMDTRNGLNRHKVRKARAKGLEKLWDLQVNGVDRKEPLIGYTAANCVSCCGICNVMKSMLTVEQFEARINAIYNHRKLGSSGRFEVLDQGFGTRRFAALRARSRNNRVA